MLAIEGAELALPDERNDRSSADCERPGHWSARNTRGLTPDEGYIVVDGEPKALGVLVRGRAGWRRRLCGAWNIGCLSETRRLRQQAGLADQGCIRRLRNSPEIAAVRQTGH